jgi:hypothetical protein
MQAAPLIITSEVTKALRDLAASAVLHPIAMPALLARLQTREGKRAHFRQMQRQSVQIATGPWLYLVSYSIETGHPCGTCRHMSMSIAREKRVPSTFAVWCVAEILGFTGGLEACTPYIEDLEIEGKAINLVQPVALHAVSETRQ